MLDLDPERSEFKYCLRRFWAMWRYIGHLIFFQFLHEHIWKKETHPPHKVLTRIKLDNICKVLCKLKAANEMRLQCYILMLGIEPLTSLVYGTSRWGKWLSQCRSAISSQFIILDNSLEHWKWLPQGHIAELCLIRKLNSELPPPLQHVPSVIKVSYYY